MLTTSSSNSPSKNLYGISILLSRPTWLNTWPFWQRIWFTTFDGGPCLFCLFRFSIFPTANFGIWANIFWIKKWRIVITYIHLIRDIWQLTILCWIKKWWIIISHVEPFYPICDTKHRKNENFQKSFTFTCPQTSMLYPLTTTQIHPSLKVTDLSLTFVQE